MTPLKNVGRGNRRGNGTSQMKSAMSPIFIAEYFVNFII
jgi:hypothetical protein